MLFHKFMSKQGLEIHDAVSVKAPEDLGNENPLFLTDKESSFEYMFPGEEMVFHLVW